MYADDSIKYGVKKNCFIYIAVNAHWEEHRFDLPMLPEEYEWKLGFEAYGFSADPGREKKLEDQTGITLGARSTAILVGEQKTKKRK